MNKKLEVYFYKTPSGNEPVREWLKSLPDEEKKIIGADIKIVQYGFPIGMPLVKHLEVDLYEVRSTLPDKIARVLFTIVDGKMMLLLHGFYKKTQKIETKDLDLARKRLKDMK